MPSQLKDEVEATFRAMPAEQLRKIFGPEKIRSALSLEERLEGLSPAENRVAIEFIQRRLASIESQPESN